MTRHLVYGAALLAVAGLIAVGAGSGAPVRKASKPAASDFTGKVILVETRKEAVTLEKVRVRQLGDHSFLVGKVVKDGILTRGTFAGATVWVPLSEVTRLVEFDSLEGLKKDMTRAARWGRGANVEVEWGGQWWPAEVTEAKDGKYQIHYTGWDNTWDEWVPDDRIRSPEKQAAPRGGK